MLFAPSLRRAPPNGGPRRLATGLTAILIAGCGHTEPFGTEAPGASGPFAQTEPTRLTYNTDADVSPAWLAGGDAFIYSFVSPERALHDRCLGRLAAAGGTIRDVLCPAATRDSTLAFEQPAVSLAGGLAYLRSSTVPLASSLPNRELWVGPDLRPGTAMRLSSLPLSGPTGRPYNTISSLRWLDAARLVFVAGNEESITISPDENPIKLPVGFDVAVLDVHAPGALQLIDGVTHPTSVSPSETADVVYYTVAGDTRVFRRALAEGAPTVAHDFGTLGIPRDIHVAGSRLTAVVGGKLHVIDDPIVGRVQSDEGGFLYLVDLTTGSERQLGTSMPDLTAGREFPLYRHPVISADGTVIAEGYVARIVNVEAPPPIARDTVIDRGGDLWRLGSP